MQCNSVCLPTQFRCSELNCNWDFFIELAFLVAAAEINIAVKWVARVETKNRLAVNYHLSFYCCKLVKVSALLKTKKIKKNPPVFRRQLSFLNRIEKVLSYPWAKEYKVCPKVLREEGKEKTHGFTLPHTFFIIVYVCNSYLLFNAPILTCENNKKKVLLKHFSRAGIDAVYSSILPHTYV